MWGGGCHVQRGQVVSSLQAHIPRASGDEVGVTATALAVPQWQRLCGSLCPSSIAGLAGVQAALLPPRHGDSSRSPCLLKAYPLCITAITALRLLYQTGSNYCSPVIDCPHLSSKVLIGAHQCSSMLNSAHSCSPVLISVLQPLLQPTADASQLHQRSSAVCEECCSQPPPPSALDERC